MNPLQRKVVERAHYLADRNDGAVYRTIHGGIDGERSEVRMNPKGRKLSNKQLIDEYEKIRARVAESEFALPVEDYMGKVQDISRAKDAIKKSKYKELLKGLSQPYEEDQVSMEQQEVIPGDHEPILPHIRQKPRHKISQQQEQLEKFKGRQNLTRREVLNYIHKNIKKREVADYLHKKRVAIVVDGEKYVPSLHELESLRKEDIFHILNSEKPDGDRLLKKKDLLKLAKLTDVGERIIGSGSPHVIELLKKIRKNYEPSPHGRSPMLAEQAKVAAKAGFPGNYYDGSEEGGKHDMTKSDIKHMQEGLKVYHRFVKHYKDFPDYGEIIDKKKAVKHAYKVYKKLLDKGHSHEEAIEKMHHHHKSIMESEGGRDVYDKKMAKLARKGVDV